MQQKKGTSGEILGRTVGRVGTLHHEPNFVYGQPPILGVIGQCNFVMREIGVCEEDEEFGESGDSIMM